MCEINAAQTKQKGQVRKEIDPCNVSNLNSHHSDTFSLVLVFLQSRHKQIPQKHHINSVSTSHISNTHVTFTRNAADHNITQSVLTRHHLSQPIVHAGKMLSITTPALQEQEACSVHDARQASHDKCTRPPGIHVFIIGSAEALPILCVSDFCEYSRERERERERDACDVNRYHAEIASDHAYDYPDGAAH